MAYTSEMKPHEKILNKLCLESGLDDLILSLLSLSDTPIERYKNKLIDNERNHVSDNLKLDLTSDDLARLDKIELNTEVFEAKGTWAREGEMLCISSKPEYIANLQKGIDNIYPDNNRDLTMVPITLLLPKSVMTESDNLEGKECNWQFIKINNESANEKPGFKELADDTQHLYGLRLFTALKLLGLAQTNNGKKKGSILFPNILRASNLSSHFELINSSDIRTHSKVDSAFHRCNGKIQSLKNKIFRINSDVNEKTKKLKKKENSLIELTITDKDAQKNKHKTLKLKEDISSLENSLAELKVKIVTLSDEKNSKENELSLLKDKTKLLKPIKHCSNINEGFFYTVPADLLYKISRTKVGQAKKLGKFILPTVGANFDCPDFSTNSTITDNEKPERADMDRMRFMLSYLFSITNGTAITIFVNKTKNELKGKKFQGVDAPLLILPRVWNELALGMKTHNPKSETDEYKDNFGASLREMCVAAVHSDFWHKRETLMREIPNILNTSASLAIKAKKKSDKCV